MNKKRIMIFLIVGFSQIPTCLLFGNEENTDLNNKKPPLSQITIKELQTVPPLKNLQGENVSLYDQIKNHFAGVQLASRA